MLLPSHLFSLCEGQLTEAGRTHSSCRELGRTCMRKTGKKVVVSQPIVDIGSV